MANRSAPKRLFKNPDRISSFQINQSPIKRMKQMANAHSDLLQNIEFVLVTAWRDDSTIDDKTVHTALRACLDRRLPDDPMTAGLVEALHAIREMREDISDHIWNEALRVVEESVRRHSERRPGEVAYLRFAAQYIK